MALRHVELARTIATKESREDGDAFAAAVLIGALAAGGYGTTPLDLDFLGHCLLNDYASVRCAAIDALASIGDPSSQDALAFSLADEELEVRLAAVRALGCLRDERGLASVVDRLIALLQRTDDRELLVATIQALGDAADPRALSVLRPIAKSGEPAAAVAAVGGDWDKSKILGVSRHSSKACPTMTSRSSKRRWACWQASAMCG